jgi:putative ABC transport system ATP-binding protein
MGQVLHIEGLRHRWPGSAQDTLVLDRLTLNQGERLFVQGPSGCGKSTLLSIAAGVMLATHGRVLVQGQDWRLLPGSRRDAHRAQHIGIVFQQFNLLPYLSVLDNVMLPCRFSSDRLRKAVAASGSAEADARRWLGALSLDNEALLRHQAALLSVGQQQRVAAARALIGEPALVIADEPTSALDDALRDTFMHSLMGACADAGSALLFVSHDTRLAHHFERHLQLASAPLASTTEATA